MNTEKQAILDAKKFMRYWTERPGPKLPWASAAVEHLRAFDDRYEADQLLIAELVKALTKLANEASLVRCMADINRHGATNMQVLGERVTQAFEALAHACERHL